MRNRPRDIRQFLGELLDRAMNQRGSHDVLAGQRLVELTLGDFLGGFLAERILAGFLQRLAQIIQDLAECALAGAVAEKAVIVLQFNIEAVDVDGRQPRAAVTGNARGRDNIVCHFAPCRCRNRDDNGQGTHLFHWRNGG